VKADREALLRLEARIEALENETPFQRAVRRWEAGDTDRENSMQVMAPGLHRARSFISGQMPYSARVHNWRLPPDIAQTRGTNMLEFGSLVRAAYEHAEDPSVLFDELERRTLNGYGCQNPKVPGCLNYDYCFGWFYLCAYHEDRTGRFWDEPWAEPDARRFGKHT
jgi:hypothetical protein